jgi:four helix bundle protein
MAKKYLKLGRIKAYQVASELSDSVWDVVSKWDWFNKRTLGVQWVDAVDSVAANIAEGFGRYHKKDKQKFYYNARGSVYESIHWTEKAFVRKLVEKDEKEKILERLGDLPKEINFLIRITGKKLKE